MPPMQRSHVQLLSLLEVTQTSAALQEFFAPRPQRASYTWYVPCLHIHPFSSGPVFALSGEAVESDPWSDGSVANQCWCPSDCLSSPPGSDCIDVRLSQVRRKKRPRKSNSSATAASRQNGQGGQVSECPEMSRSSEGPSLVDLCLGE